MNKHNSLAWMGTPALLLAGFLVASSTAERSRCAGF